MLDRPFLGGGSVEAGKGGEAAADRGRGLALVFEVACVHLDVGPNGTTTSRSSQLDVLLGFRLRCQRDRATDDA